MDNALEGGNGAGLHQSLLSAAEDGEGGKGRNFPIPPTSTSTTQPIGIRQQGGDSPRSDRRSDSFGDQAFLSSSPGYTTAFDPTGGLRWEKVEPGKMVYKVRYIYIRLLTHLFTSVYFPLPL